MCFAGPSMPGVTEAPKSPTEQDPVIQAKLADERKRRAQAAGLASTMLTGSSGLTMPATTTNSKSLLGS